jgi:hypothetical protein
MQLPNNYKMFLQTVGLTATDEAKFYNKGYEKDRITLATY